MIRLIRNLTGKDENIPYLPNPFIQLHEPLYFSLMGFVLVAAMLTIAFLFTNAY
jgi:hypothetical protein